jgi:hypothetical protein
LFNDCIRSWTGLNCSDFMYFLFSPREIAIYADLAVSDRLGDKDVRFEFMSWFIRIKLFLSITYVYVRLLYVSACFQAGS